MKAVIYTDKKLVVKHLAKLQVRNVEILPVLVTFPKFTTQEITSYDKNNKPTKEVVIKWEEIQSIRNIVADFIGIVIKKTGYKISGDIQGMQNTNLFQVFNSGSFPSDVNACKHELLHALSWKLGKPDTLHAYLKAGHTLEDYEEDLWRTEPQKKSEQLLKLAQDTVGKDASPLDTAEDEYGCADSVSNLIKKVIPDFPIIVSTAELFKECDKRLKRTTELKAGNILISPTGYGNGKLSNGHTGILGDHEIIYSNDSYSGNWMANYTVTSWVNRYRKIGNFPLYVFNID